MTCSEYGNLKTKKGSNGFSNTTKNNQEAIFLRIIKEFYFSQMRARYRLKKNLNSVLLHDKMQGGGAGGGEHLL